MPDPVSVEKFLSSTFKRLWLKDPAEICPKSILSAEYECVQ